jgi:hypothetical protein
MDRYSFQDAILISNLLRDDLSGACGPRRVGAAISDQELAIQLQAELVENLLQSEMDRGYALEVNCVDLVAQDDHVAALAFSNGHRAPPAQTNAPRTSDQITTQPP